MSVVLFLSGSSQGDTLKMLGQSYQTLFNAQGYEFVALDLLDPPGMAKTLTRILAEKPIEFAFSFMGFGSGLTGNDEHGRVTNLWQGIGAPFLALLGDSPAYYFDLHVAKFPIFASLYGFPEHAELRRRLPHANSIIGQFKPILFDAVALEDLDFKAKANGQLLFLKNGNDPKQLWDSWNVLTGLPLRALRDLAAHLVSDLTDPAGNQIDDLVMEYFANCGFDISPMPKLRLFFVAQLDDYLRRMKSTMMAEALMKFPVQIVGVNWEHLDFSGERVTHIKECNYAKSSHLIKESLGVIDMSPNTEMGPHDRACRSFGSYTVCLTNEQKFFQQTLPHSEAFSFHFDRESFQDKVADVLAHPARYVDVGIEVATAFREANPAEAAVRHLIDTAAMVRLDQRRERLPSSPNFFVWPPQSLS